MKQVIAQYLAHNSIIYIEHTIMMSPANLSVCLSQGWISEKW